MIVETTYDDIIRNVRKLIIEKLSLSGERVLNADSVRGADLEKILNETDVMSIDLSDIFIVFELIEDNNDDNYIIPEDDLSISSLASFKFILHIYGNMSAMCAQQISTIFKSSSVATTLHDYGIYLAGISFPENTKEFINNTLWPRRDMELYLKVRFNFKNLEKNEYFDDTFDNVDLNVRKI